MISVVSSALELKGQESEQGSSDSPPAPLFSGCGLAAGTSAPPGGWPLSPWRYLRRLRQPPRRRPPPSRYTSPTPLVDIHMANKHPPSYVECECDQNHRPRTTCRQSRFPRALIRAKAGSGSAWTKFSRYHGAKYSTDAITRHCCCSLILVLVLVLAAVSIL